MSCQCCLLVFAVVLMQVQSNVASIHLSLNGNSWTAVNSNRSIHTQATVPGSIYTDLTRNGFLGNPLYRFNDVEYRWVAHDSWTYTRTFGVSQEYQQHSVIKLLCGGIDTVSTIKINGHLVGTTDNMFHRYTFDVKPMLQVGQNEIEVSFTSPLQYSLDQSKEYPYPVPVECPPADQHGECHYNFIRKMAASYSWDWGPAFPTMGIWKNLTLEAYDRATIKYFTAETNMRDRAWVLSGAVYVEVDPALTEVSATLDISIPSHSVHHSQTVQVTPDSHQIRYTLNIPPGSGIEAWWPNGHGAQPLYQLKATLTLEGKETVARGLKIGFRTVELVQEPVEGSSGLSFYFKINGVPIFMKGSNWIPANNFQELITEDYLHKLLGSAAKANMNMLRVWGGGVYESSAFYSLADELGILLWQDFMFACSLYPSDQDFLANVRREVTHQLRVLQHHPSIAIWAGNNENEGNVLAYKGQPIYDRYYDDYVRLYRDTVADVVQMEDRSRPFVPSSPSDGVLSLQQGYVADNPQDTHYGDVHFYDYNMDSWNWTSFPIPRFASEYGLQSWSSYESLVEVSREGDWTPNSEFCVHRQHHPDGNTQMFKEFSAHIAPPTSEPSLQNFQDYIYVTQINQAMGIKREAEHYRGFQDDLYQGQGRTMGSLYWQLNDIWQAPTWASIEYGGKWKMLHYYAREFYNQTILSPYIFEDHLRVEYIDDTPASAKSPNFPYGADDSSHNDIRREKDHLNIKAGHDTGSRSFAVAAEGESLKFQPLEMQEAFWKQASQVDDGSEQLELHLRIYSWGSLKPALERTLPFSKPPASAATMLVLDEQLDGILRQAGCPSRNHCFVQVSLDADNTDTSNWLPLSTFKTAQGLRKANVKVRSVSKLDEQTVAITLSTDAVAPFVWLEVWGTGGSFSSNGFMMTQGHVTLKFHAWRPVEDLDHFRTMLTVKSLMDIYK